LPDFDFQHSKYHLLQAESLHSIGDAKASEEYDLSIKAAQAHRFLNEEAMACERAGLFHLKFGRKELSDRLLQQAYECYRSWGAEKKANALLETLQ